MYSMYTVHKDVLPVNISKDPKKVTFFSFLLLKMLYRQEASESPVDSSLTFFQFFYTKKDSVNDYADTMLA